MSACTEEMTENADGFDVSSLCYKADAYQLGLIDVVMADFIVGAYDNKTAECDTV